MSDAKHPIRELIEAARYEAGQMALACLAPSKAYELCGEELNRCADAAESWLSRYEEEHLRKREPMPGELDKHYLAEHLAAMTRERDEWKSRALKAESEKRAAVRETLSRVLLAASANTDGELGEECKHGHLRRKCRLCELEGFEAAIDSELAALNREEGK